MAHTQRRYTEEFKRRVVERMTADPGEISRISEEIGVARSRLYEWRKQFAASPLHPGESPGLRLDQESPGVRADTEPGSEVGEAINERLRQSLLETAFALTAAIRDTTDSAPLNQLSAALGLVIDRLLKLEALVPHDAAPAGEEIIRIEYKYPDGTIHHSPPWAEGDPAFEEPIRRGRVRSPFWENRDRQDDDSGDGAARG